MKPGLKGGTAYYHSFWFKGDPDNYVDPFHMVGKLVVILKFVSSARSPLAASGKASEGELMVKSCSLFEKNQVPSY
ncbi:MAG: hypothetical protein R2727_05825 [Bacteroidales bacterium]